MSSRDVVSILAGAMSLLLLLGALAVAGMRWELKRRLPPNWALCLLFGVGFAVVGVVMGAIVTDGDWGTTLVVAAILGIIGLVCATLAWPPFAHG